MKSRYSFSDFIYERNELRSWGAITLGGGLLLSGLYVALTFISYSNGDSVLLETVRTLVNDGTVATLALGVSILNAYLNWRVLNKVTTHK